MPNRPAILVTGGAGYIGSHCCSALSAAGYMPVCFDNLTTGQKDFVKWGPLVVGDLNQTGLIYETLERYDILAVMHFAAASLVGESIVDPIKYYMNNVAGSLSLVTAMRQADCTKLVFSSTGAIYGDATGGPIREDAACAPVNPYGQSKLAVERMLADCRTSYGFQSICLRYFNASGADASCLIGEQRAIETHLIPRLLMKLQGELDEFAIFGDDYDTPDGTAIRDYIHVVDLAKAHLLALKLMLAGYPGGAFNLGTGCGYSVRDILTAAGRVTGLSLDVPVKPRRTGDPAMLVADVSLAKRQLNFVATNSDLDSIIRSAWAWQVQRHAIA